MNFDFKVWDVENLVFVPFEEAIKNPDMNIEEILKKRCAGDERNHFEHCRIGSTPPLMITETRIPYAVLAGTPIERVNELRIKLGSVRMMAKCLIDIALTEEEKERDMLHDYFTFTMKAPPVDPNTGLVGCYELTQMRLKDGNRIEEGPLFEKYAGIIRRMDINAIVRREYTEIWERNNWPMEGWRR